MLFKSRKGNEMKQIDVSGKIKYNDPLLNELPVNTNIIKVDKEIQNAKDLGLVTR